MEPPHLLSCSYCICDLLLIAILGLIFRAAWKLKIIFTWKSRTWALQKSWDIFQNLCSVFPCMVRAAFSYNMVEKYGLIRKPFDFRSGCCFSTFLNVQNRNYTLKQKKKCWQIWILYFVKTLSVQTKWNFCLKFMLPIKNKFLRNVYNHLPKSEFLYKG